MAYTHYNPAAPDAVTQNGAQFGTATRQNLQALRDMVIAGVTPGWAMAPSGGTASQPAVITYSNATERLRVSLTWGTTGGAAGNVTAAAYSYSADAGSTWDAIGARTIDYDAAGFVTGTTWS